MVLQTPKEENSAIQERISFNLAGISTLLRQVGQCANIRHFRANLLNLVEEFGDYGSVICSDIASENVM